MSILEAAIAILAPPQCVGCDREGSALCQSCTNLKILPFGERCWRCNRISPASKTCASCAHTGSPRHVWIVTDHDDLARDLLGLYKFGHQRAAVLPIAKLMLAAFLEFSVQLQLAAKDYLVVPVPTATSRIRQRGFGHSELLARKIAHGLKIEYGNSLRRLSQTRQLGSKREDRLKQLSASFAVRSQKSLSGRNILLIDDVVTTGGTLIAATKTLHDAGAKNVDALLFAKRL